MSVDLAFDRIAGTRPDWTVAFLHGLLGRRNNLRTIARRFVDARPEWAAMLVDLRGHGESPKGAPSPSLEATADDVAKLAARAEQPVRALVGHSFGGKVALETMRIQAIPSLAHVVVIDSVPGARNPMPRGGSALDVVEMLESLPSAFASRSDFVEAIVAKGQKRGLATWLAQSLERQNNQVRLALNLNEARSLLVDYFARDFWPIVEEPPAGISVHLIIGDRSDSYSPSDRARAARIATSNPRVTVDVLPAGHWVHVDDADGLLNVLNQRL
jgi:esterase